MKDIIIRNDDRFKSVFVGVNMLLPLKNGSNHKNALLALVLKKSSSMFSNEKELERELASLFNTTIDVDVEKIDNLYNIHFLAEFLNVEYMTEDALNKIKDIFVNLICNPRLASGKFPQDVFEREKASLIERIKEERDDKKKYALRELEKDMFLGTPYADSLYGNIENLEKTTNEELVEHFKEVISTAQIIVEASGNLNHMEEFPKQVLKEICEKCGKHEVKNLKNVDTLNHSLKRREEFQDIAQSIIAIGLKIKDFTKEDIFKAMLFNTILGGTPASKLFQNVREKESLAYFAKSVFSRFKGVIYMYAGVEPVNNKKAEEVMLKQIDLLKAGELTDTEFNAAKQNLVSGYKQMQDTKVSYVKSILTNYLIFDKEVSFDEIIANIEKIKMDEIIDFAKRIVPTNIFLLGGKTNE